MVELTDSSGSCDEASLELREVKVEAFDETGSYVPPTRLEYSYAGIYPHSSTRLFQIWYWFRVQRGGDYHFQASFPNDKWPVVRETQMVPQHRDEAPVVVLPTRCSSVGSLGPNLRLCDGTLFRGDTAQWSAPTDGGQAISRAVDGVAWVHAEGMVYRFEAGDAGAVQSAQLARSYEVLTATATELFLQAPSGIARVTFDERGGLALAEAEFTNPLAYEDPYGPGGLGVLRLVHGVQASNGKLASVWLYRRGRVRTCRWSIPDAGVPVLSPDDCVEESAELAGVGSAGAWVTSEGQLSVRDYTTRPPADRFSRPYGYRPGLSGYEVNRRWFDDAAPHPKPDGSIAFDAWDIPQVTVYEEACRTWRWDAEDDLAWIACGYRDPLYTLVWRRPTGTP